MLPLEAGLGSVPIAVQRERMCVGKREREGESGCHLHLPLALVSASCEEEEEEVVKIASKRVEPHLLETGPNLSCWQVLGP